VEPNQVLETEQKLLAFLYLIYARETVESSVALCRVDASKEVGRLKAPVTEKGVEKLFDFYNEQSEVIWIYLLISGNPPSKYCN